MSGSIYVRENENVSITCYAEGARPAASLSLDGSNINMGSHSNIVTTRDNITNDANLTSTVEVKNEVQTVSCTSTMDEINENETIHLQLKTYGKYKKRMPP